MYVGICLLFNNWEAFKSMEPNNTKDGQDLSPPLPHLRYNLSFTIKKT